MTTLFITTLDAQGRSREVSFDAKLDVVLNQLSYLNARNRNVVQACVIDQHQRLELPLHLLDDQPFSAPFRRRKHQWEVILSAPMSALSVQTRYYIELMVSRLKHYKVSQQSHEQSIRQFRQLRQQALEQFPVEEASANLVGHYEALIAYNELNLTRIKEQRESAQKWLSQLQCKLQGESLWQEPGWGWMGGPPMHEGGLN